MWTNALLDLLPIAAAVALSPIPIIAIVLVLAAPRARTAGPAFAGGWVIGLAAVSSTVVIVAGGASDPDSQAAEGVNWLKVAIGVLFLGMAAQQWRKRPKDGAEPDMPKWMASIDSVEPRRAFVLGLALSAANPKNLALTLAAAASIAQAGLTDTDTVIAIVLFVFLGSITVAGAVVFYLLDSKRAGRPLAAVKRFMTKHNAVIMTIVLLLLGAKLLVNGFGGLSR